MQLQNLIIIAALATGVYGQWNEAWCDGNKEHTIVDSPATRAACEDAKLSGGCKDCVTMPRRYVGGLGVDATCVSPDKLIWPTGWPAFCRNNGAKEGGRGATK